MAVKDCFSLINFNNYFGNIKVRIFDGNGINDIFLNYVLHPVGWIYKKRVFGRLGLQVWLQPSFWVDPNLKPFKVSFNVSPQKRLPRPGERWLGAEGRHSRGGSPPRPEATASCKSSNRSHPHRAYQQQFQPCCSC